MPLQAEREEFRLSVWKPESFTLNLFKERLEAYGVKIQGKTFFDSISRGVILYQIQRPVDSIIFNINKTSNNLAAENLLKTIGAEMIGRPGSAEKGIGVINKFISKLGIDTTRLFIADGSGVSRYSLISTDAIIKLLKYVYRERANYNRFYNSLSVGGIDGNLKNRFLTDGVKNNIRAKTGTHSDALSLSGYLNTTNGDTLAFSIILNNFIGNSRKYRDAIDKICELLVNFE
jgi:serine-type D-Ala-D-Ala carboxypeptidase/endopeptidase (penicillin-binding protein 4)